MGTPQPRKEEEKVAVNGLLFLSPVESEDPSEALATLTHYVRSMRQIMLDQSLHISLLEEQLGRLMRHVEDLQRQFIIPQLTYSPGTFTIPDIPYPGVTTGVVPLPNTVTGSDTIALNGHFTIDNSTIQALESYMAGEPLRSDHT